MAIIFNPDTGFIADETGTIRNQIATDWKTAFKTDESAPELNTGPETPAGQLIDGMAALVAEKDGEVLRLANGFNPKTATGIYQDALAVIYFLDRQVAQPTLVTCQCAGLQGTIIPYGAVVQDVNGYTFYNINATTIGATGIAECIFRCSQYGPIQVGANIVNKIITVIPGWDSVNNAAAGAPGRDFETQAEFEQRRSDSVAKNAHGLAEAVEGTVGNIDGVIACRIEQNRGDVTITKYGVTIPPHSVYLSVYGGEQEKIAMAMHEKIDGGCGTTGNTKVTIADPTNGSEQVYYYQSPTVVGAAVKVTLKQTATTPTTITADIKAAVLANFNGQTVDEPRVKMGDTLYASRFYNSVTSAGVKNLSSIEVAFPSNGIFSDEVDIPLDNMPTLSEDDVTVILEA